jgi:hypothetical protein
MADTQRQQIVAALLTRLQGILTTSGYETNAGQHVFEWPDVELSEEDEMPAVVVRDTDGPVERATNSKDLHTMVVGIECLAKGSTAPAEVRKVMGDVVKAVGVDLWFGGLAHDTNLVGTSIRQMSQEDRRLGGGEIVLQIEYLTDHMNLLN